MGETLHSERPHCWASRFACMLFDHTVGVSEVSDELAVFDVPGGGAYTSEHWVVSFCLLQRHKHLNDATALRQGLKRLPDHRTKHLASVGTFHRVTGNGRSHQQVADLDRPIFCRNFTGYDAHDSKRNFVLWCRLVHFVLVVPSNPGLVE